MNASVGVPHTTPATLGLDLDRHGFVYYRSMPLTLAPTARGVLQLLLREWPAVVGKQRFAQEVWNGVMSDESLARCMTQLRAALAGVPGLKIRAVYGEGYQLQVTDVAAVTPQFHLRLRDTAMAAPALAETLMHARMLIQQYTPSSLLRAEDLLRGLMEHAPDYASARIAFAESLAAQVSCGMGLRPARLDEGLALLAAAAARTPDAAGLRSQQAHLLDCAWRFADAAPLHASALRADGADPATHYHHAWHLLACDRVDEAVAAMEAAHALAPYSCEIAIMLARAHTFADTPETGMAYARKAHADHPDSLQAYVHLLAYEASLDPSPALVDKLLGVRLGPRAWSFAASSVAYGLARCGALEAAAAIIARHDTDNPSMRASFTSVLLLLGETDAALARLADAAELGCGFLPVSMRAPENRPLRTHAGYPDVAARVFAAMPVAQN